MQEKQGILEEFIYKWSLNVNYSFTIWVQAHVLLNSQISVGIIRLSLAKNSIDQSVLSSTLNPRKRFRLKKIPFVPQFSPSLLNVQCLWERLAAITQIQKSPSSPIKPQQRWSHSAPGVRKQCCSGNFRASPPVAFTVPSFFVFFFFTPAGAKMPHNSAFPVRSGSSHMLMFYSLCAPWKGGIALYYTDTRCQQANIYNINIIIISDHRVIEYVAMNRSRKNRVIKMEKWTPWLFLSKGSFVFQSIFPSIGSQRYSLVWYSVWRFLMSTFWTSQADLIQSLFMAAFICFLQVNR